MEPLRIGAIVLCGGESRRMHRDKAWLECGDELLLQRVVRIVSSVAADLIVAAAKEQALPPLPGSVTVVHDAVANMGPLVGLAAGLAALRDQCDAALVVSCDQPLLRPAFLHRLIELLEGHRAVIPQHADRLHGLTAIYRTNVELTIAGMLAEGERRVRILATRCEAHVVQASEFKDADPELESLQNANDPTVYEDLLRRLSD